MMLRALQSLPHSDSEEQKSSFPFHRLGNEGFEIICVNLQITHQYDRAGIKI